MATWCRRAHQCTRWRTRCARAPQGDAVIRADDHPFARGGPEGACTSATTRRDEPTAPRVPPKCCTRSLVWHGVARKMRPHEICGGALCVLIAVRALEAEVSDNLGESR